MVFQPSEGTLITLMILNLLGAEQVPGKGLPAHCTSTPGLQGTALFACEESQAAAKMHSKPLQGPRAAEREPFVLPV